MSGVINIREPIWKGMMVGVDSYKFNDLLYVQILYKNVHGSKMFPFILKMRGNIARMYPVQRIQGHEIHLIPIKDFEPTTLRIGKLGRRSKAKQTPRVSDVPGTTIVYG